MAYDCFDDDDCEYPLNNVVTQDGWIVDEGVVERSSPQEVKSFIQMFFEGINYYLGGPIPKQVLLEDRNVNIVLRLDLSDCIPIFYKVLETLDFSERDSIELFFDLQKRAAKLQIPKQHSGGLLLLWLMLHRGVEL